jgi:hypothetical protein
MKRTFLLFGFLSLCWSTSLAADRLSDREVKALVERIEDGRDRFEDALDGNLKRSVLRGPSGDVNVEHFLNDFQENVGRLKERMKPEYVASAEVGTLLRQATRIDAFFRQQPAGTRGESEWNRLAADLKGLAGAYGADFPITEQAVVRRLGDRELSGAADELSRASDRLKKALDSDLKKDPSVDKAARQAIVSEADQLTRDTKTLRDRIKDGNPSSAEAERVITRAAKLRSFIDGHNVPTAAGIWKGASARIQSLSSEFGLGPGT